MRIGLLLWFGALGSILSGCSCEEDDSRPANVLRHFLQAAAEGSTDEVFGLLTPEVQDKLRKLSSLATAQSGGRQRYQPSDLLATTLTPRGTYTIKLLTENDQRAKLQASAPKRPAEVWHLRRVEKRWRIELPTASLRLPPRSPPPSPAAATDGAAEPG